MRSVHGPRRLKKLRSVKSNTDRGNIMNGASFEDYMTMTSKKLKALCAACKLTQRGTKTVMAKRLVDADL